MRVSVARHDGYIAGPDGFGKPDAAAKVHSGPTRCAGVVVHYSCAICLGPYEAVSRYSACATAYV